MLRAPLDDPRRLDALRDSELIDSPPEAAFDRLTALAARMPRAPAALVSRCDVQRQFLKGQVRLAEPWRSARGTPISLSFCPHVVTTAAPLIVENAREHPVVRDNGAIDELDVQAYAGMPVADS